MENLIIPMGYKSILDVKTTEKAIKFVKDQFEEHLSSELRLRRVTAPIVVLKGTGINDDLNGIERPVAFPIKGLDDQVGEVVQSLAKWKRYMLGELGIDTGRGIYTDMNALRPDEEFTNLHSIYVDQWDWERVILGKDRSIDFLKIIVKKIFRVLKRVEYSVYDAYPQLKEFLPEDITFIHAEDLLQQYPGFSPKERENKAAKEYGAIFVIGIGANLSNGEPHDGRAPDYDDWVTETSPGYKGLNGDIIVWNPVLERAFEISSMGIRVGPESLLKQLEIQGQESRKELMFHKKLLAGELPLSIGGGIGQSRICMLLLQKAHIGEVQSSIWPEYLKSACKENNIFLL